MVATRWRRRCGRITVYLLLTGSVAACSSSGNSSAGSSSYETLPILPTVSAAGPASDSAPPTDDSADDNLSVVGSLALPGVNGELVTTTLSVDPATDFADAHVPEDAVNTCDGWSNSSAESNAIGIHGKLTVSYQGHVQTLVQLTYADIQQLSQYADLRGTTNHGVIGGVAVHDPSGTQWDLCTAGGGGLWQASMNPGDSVTVDIYGFAVIKSNAHPTITPEDKEALTMHIQAIAADQRELLPNALVYHASGPQAASCTDLEEVDAKPFTELLLYATPPIIFAGPGFKLSCKPAG